MGQLPSTFIAENIVYHIVKIGGGVKGLVFQSKKGRYHIFVSDSLSATAQKEVLFHELYHITHDMPKMGYIIGFDMQHEEFEQEANAFSQLMMNIISTLV